MGKTSGSVRYLGFQEIVEINRKLIISTGGFTDNAGEILNASSLHYLVEIVKSEILGEELYPSLSEKASVYGYNIITRHVFVDGNKRTGIACALLFLELNGLKFDNPPSDDEIVNMALGIANNNISQSEFNEWLGLKLGLSAG